MATITILGAGVMGSAMAIPASDRGHRVRLVGTHLDRAIIDHVKEAGFHPRLGVNLPPLEAFQYEDIGETLGEDTDLILLGVSSAGSGWGFKNPVVQASPP